MGLTLILLVAALGICPLVTVVKGFVVVAQERHEARMQNLSRMVRSVLSSRYADEIKETAMFYGIDSNEADVDIVDLLEHREMLVKYLGEKTYNNISKRIKSSKCYSLSYKIIVNKRHCVNRLLDTAALVVNPEFRVVHLVKTGGDSDAEAAA